MAVIFDQCRNLQSALNFETQAGACFIRSIALALDLPQSELVFGEFRAASAHELLTVPNASPEPFIHAWVEMNGKVYAPTLIAKMGGLPAVSRDAYYATNMVARTWRVDQATLQTVAKKFKLASAFRHGKNRAGKGDVTETLLKAAGVPYKISERRTAIPA